MAKGLVYADNHLSQYSSIVRQRENGSSVRLTNSINSLNWAEGLVKEYKCDFVIGLGDTFDRPDLNAEELTALQNVKWASVPHYFLVGNHEMGVNDLSYSSAHLLNMVPMAKVINEPFTIEPSMFERETRLVFLPYILESNRKEFSYYVPKTDSYEKTIVFSHNDISGIRYGQYESKIGFNIKEIYDHCDLYLNGHLHNQQQINEKILNIGNLTGQNFSEDAEKFSHCAAIIDTETLEVRLINNPYAFNFYKYEILTKDDIDKLNKCKENAVLSIKTYTNLINDIKEKLNEIKPISYRLITIPQDKIETKEIKEFTRLDHIEQFKKYVCEQIGESDLLLEELNNL